MGSYVRIGSHPCGECQRLPNCLFFFVFNAFFAVDLLLESEAIGFKSLGGATGLGHLLASHGRGPGI